jgi:hypothetical protein
MVDNTRDYWVFGLCPTSGILKYYRTERFGNCVCFLPQVRGLETSALSGQLGRALVNGG